MPLVIFSFSSCNFHFFFLLLFLTSQTTKPIFFSFSSCFFSHPNTKTQLNWIETDCSQVGLVFLPYRSVSVPNMAKPKSSVWCKNCLQHQPLTDYTPWCLSFKKFSTILGFMMNSWVRIDVSEFWLEKNEYWWLFLSWNRGQRKTKKDKTLCNHT